MTEENGDKSLQDPCPKHFKALTDAELVVVSGKVPTLKEETSKRVNQIKDKRKVSQNERNRRRASYFCVGYNDAWEEPVHQIIKRVKDKFKLSWLRVSMSYHRFTNLREIFQGDMSGKLTKEVVSVDCANWKCNCRSKNTNGCGKCRTKG